MNVSHVLSRHASGKPVFGNSGHVRPATLERYREGLGQTQLRVYDTQFGKVHDSVGIPPGFKLNLYGRLPWPIAVRSVPFHIATIFLDDQNWGKIDNDMVHTGVDFLAPEGTVVRACQSGWVYMVRRFPWANMAEVSIFSEESQMLWHYAHLHLSSIERRFQERKTAVIAGRDAIQVEAGQMIGRIGKYPKPIDRRLTLPASVERVFGRRFDHVHLQTEFVTRPGWMRRKTKFEDSYFRDWMVDGTHIEMNPLLLLQPLVPHEG